MQLGPKDDPELFGSHQKSQLRFGNHKKQMVQTYLKHFIFT